MKIRPVSRKENIVVQELENELLVYDLKTNKAFCLNETSAIVFQLCDGQKAVAEISDLMGRKLKTLVSEDFVRLALHELKRDGLLENAHDYEDYFAGMSRRELVKKVGLASITALPIVSSVVAPNAAMAQSGTNLPLNAACANSNQCASGNCVNGSTCCSPTSTGTEAPFTLLGLLDGPPNATCASYSPGQQLADCNGQYNAASCCNGIITLGGCSFDGTGIIFRCRCAL